jgi:hypothetical protein
MLVTAREAKKVSAKDGTIRIRSLHVIGFYCQSALKISQMGCDLGTFLT